MVAGGVLLIVRTSARLRPVVLPDRPVHLRRPRGRRGSAARVGERIRAVTVEDVMDREPVTVPVADPAARGKGALLQREAGVPWLAVTDDDGRYRGLLLAARVEDELRDGRPALTAGEISIDSPPVADRRLGHARGRAALGWAAPARRDRRRRRRRHPARNRDAAAHSPGDASVGCPIESGPHRDARTRRPDHRRRPGRPARRPRRRPRGRFRRDHEQGPPGPIALGGGRRRHQRGDQRRRRLALARL